MSECTMYLSSSQTSAFHPVLAKRKRIDDISVLVTKRVPRDYRKGETTQSFATSVFRVIPTSCSPLLTIKSAPILDLVPVFQIKTCQSPAQLPSWKGDPTKSIKHKQSPYEAILIRSPTSDGF